MGILFATIVMMVHNNNLPEEKIIEQAKKLGMVMPEDTEESGGLWGNKEEDFTQETETSETESQSAIETTLPLDTEEQGNSQISESTETVQDSQQLTDSQMVSDTSADVQPPAESQEVTYVKITINAKNSAERVCRTLYQNGLIDSEEDFHAYLQEMGYTHIIQKGTFDIPMGATYEEICAIIIKAEYL